MSTDPYPALQAQLASLLAEEGDPIANAANTCALLLAHLRDLNWVGFYFLRDGTLVLGPFQGRPARTRIALTEGVCGRAARERRTQVVGNVHACPDHIACDMASRAEIVIPLIEGAHVRGVLDLDSPRPERFGAGDRLGLEAVAACYLAHSRF